MHKIKRLIDKPWLPWVLLLVIAVISHLEWFNPFSILTHGDWSYWNTQATKELQQGWAAWFSYSNLGSVNIQITFYAFNIIWAALAHLNIGYEFAPKITLMIPLAILGFIAPYMYTLKIFKDRWIAFFCALFYGTTTYFLVRQTGQIPIIFVYSIAPLLLYLFERALESKKFQSWFNFTLVFWVATFVEIRIALIVAAILLLHIIFISFKMLTKNVKNIVFAGILFIGLNLFWFLPTLLGGATSDIARVANRGLFGNNLFDLQHAIALVDSAWTGKVPNELFIPQPIKYYLWFFPALAFLGVVLGLRSRVQRERKYVIFFLVVSIIGIFITKQSDTPLPGSYEFLYGHIPGFNLFREASKFYIVTAIGYLGLVGFGIKSIKELAQRKSSNLVLFYGVGTALVLFCFINLWPFITMQSRTLFVARTIPQAYVDLQKIMSNDVDYYRTMWAPSVSRWGFFSLNHPKTDEIGVIQSNWLEVLGGSQKISNDSPRKQAADFFSLSIAQKLVESSAIKYIFVPLRDQQNDDDLFKYYGDDRAYFTDALANIPWLKHIPLVGKGIDTYAVANPRPYIDASTQVLSFSKIEDLNRTFGFASEEILKDPDFALSDGAIKLPTGTSQVGSLLAGIKPSDVSKGKVVKNITANPNSILYSKNTDLAYAYSIKSQILTLKTTIPNAVKINGKTFGANPQSLSSPGLVLDQQRSYMLQIGSRLSDIPTDSVERELGIFSQDIQIDSIPKTNLIPKSDVISAKTNDKVEDCNNYDDNRRIGMEVKGGPDDDEQQYLQLWAELHTACIGVPPAAITPGGQYAFGFDYRSKIVKEVAYEIEFDDVAKTSVKEYLPSTDGNWHTYTRSITAPSGATHASIHLLGLPDTDHRVRSYSDYRNVLLAPLTVERKPAILQQNASTKYALDIAGQARIEAEDQSITGENLIPNPSFESGLWQDKVGDCNSFDNHPILKMNTDNKNHSDGGQSLKLEVGNHTACTGPKNEISVQENGLYLFNFDYQSPNGDQAEYYMQFNDPDHTVVSEHLPITTSNWQTLSRNIRTPVGATKLTLAIYGFSKDHTTAKIITRYDNFELMKIPDSVEQYFIADTLHTNLKKPNKISFSATNPTKKNMTIKGATTPFYLSMSEAFHPNWRLEMNNGKVQGLGSWLPDTKVDAIPAADHFKLNDFENGWYVDVDKLCRQQHLCKQNADGSYDLEMIAEFTPQRWFYVGLIISGTTLAGCLGFLGATWYRRRRKPAQSSRPTAHGRPVGDAHDVPRPARRNEIDLSDK